jgi:hypothetical protein
MRTMFERSFTNGFGRSMPMGFRPAMGQDIVTSYDQLDQSGGAGAPGAITSYDQAPPPSDQTTAPTPTPYVPPASPLSPAVAPKIPAQQPAGMSDTDWAKLLAQGITAAGAGYGAYTKAEIDKMNAQAAVLKARNPGAASIIPSTGLSTGATIALAVGGLAVVGLVIAVAMK